LLQVRRAEVEVQVGDGDPLRIERHVESARRERRRAGEQLREATGAGGREGLGIEHALLADDGDQQQRVDRELRRLPLDGAAVRPREDGAQHARIVGSLERSLPAEPHGGGPEAAAREPVTPRQQCVEVLLRRPPENGPDLGLGRGVEAGEQRSEEHTSELQSPYDLVCRLLLEKKKQNYTDRTT